MSDLIGVVVATGCRLQVEPVKGESGTVWRQMVRGLLALVHQLTGEVPRRISVRRTDRYPECQVEDYWFLSLSQKLAETAHRQAVSATSRTQAPADALDEGRGGSGSEVIDRRAPKRVSPKSKGSSKGNSAQRPQVPPRKPSGAPSLAAIVREELDALKAELATKP